MRRYNLCMGPRATNVLAAKILATCVAVVLLVGSVGQAEARSRRRRAKRVGTLQIASQTTGAEISIDGKLVGTLPLPKPLRLKPGKHTLKLTKKGYTQYLDVFRIRRGRRTTLSIDLLPMAGVLWVSSNVEGSLVYVDGQFAGTAPVETEVLVGERAVRVSKPGYHDFIGQLKARGGSRHEIRASLRPLPVGTSPYRPAPPPPDQWYEKWYVWAGAAAGVAAVAVGIIVPVLLTRGDPVEDFEADYRFRAGSEAP